MLPIDSSRTYITATSTGEDLKSSRSSATFSNYASAWTGGGGSWLLRKGKELFDPLRADHYTMVPKDKHDEVFLSQTRMLGETRDTVEARGVLMPEYDRPVSKLELERRAISWGKEFHRNREVYRGPTDTFQTVLGFGASLAGDVTEPVNLALMVMGPWLVGTKKLFTLSKMAKNATHRSVLKRGVLPTRTVAGLGANFVASAATEPFYGLQTKYKGVHEYTVGDLIMNITMGTAVGGGIYVGGGTMRDALISSGKMRGLTLQRKAQLWNASRTGVDRDKIRRMLLDGNTEELDLWILDHFDSEMTLDDVDLGTNIFMAMIHDFDGGFTDKGRLFKKLTAIDIGVRLGHFDKDEAFELASKLVAEADKDAINPRKRFEMEGLDVDEELASVEQVRALKAARAGERHPDLGPEVTKPEAEMDALQLNEKEIKSLLHASFLCYEPAADPRQGQLDLSLGQQEIDVAEPRSQGDIAVELRREGYLGTVVGQHQMEFDPNAPMSFDPDNPPDWTEHPDQMELDFPESEGGPVPPDQTRLNFGNDADQMDLDIPTVATEVPGQQMEFPEGDYVGYDSDLPDGHPDQMDLDMGSEQMELEGVTRGRGVPSPSTPELRSLLGKKTITQLKALAKERGIHIPSRMRKSQIIDKLSRELEPWDGDTPTAGVEGEQLDLEKGRTFISEPEERREAARREARAALAQEEKLLEKKRDLLFEEIRSSTLFGYEADDELTKRRKADRVDELWEEHESVLDEISRNREESMALLTPEELKKYKIEDILDSKRYLEKERGLLKDKLELLDGDDEFTERKRRQVQEDIDAITGEMQELTGEYLRETELDFDLKFDDGSKPTAEILDFPTESASEKQITKNTLLDLDEANKETTPAEVEKPVAKKKPAVEKKKAAAKKKPAVEKKKPAKLNINDTTKEMDEEMAAEKLKKLTEDEPPTILSGKALDDRNAEFIEVQEAKDKKISPELEHSKKQYRNRWHTQMRAITTKLTSTKKPEGTDDDSVFYKIKHMRKKQEKSNANPDAEAPLFIEDELLKYYDAADPKRLLEKDMTDEKIDIWLKDSNKAFAEFESSMGIAQEVGFIYDGSKYDALDSPEKEAHAHVGLAATRLRKHFEDVLREHTEYKEASVKLYGDSLQKGSLYRAATQKYYEVNDIPDNLQETFLDE